MCMASATPGLTLASEKRTHCTSQRFIETMA